MKRVMIIAIIQVFSAYAICQNPGWAVETMYDFSMKEKANIQLPNVMDSIFLVNAKLTVTRNARFCLYLFQETSLTNKSLANSGSNEEKSDSLLFDLSTKIVYNLRSGLAYTFHVRNYEVPAGFKDSFRIQKGDTGILIDHSLDKFSSPSPTIPLFAGGIRSYSTKKFSFRLATTGERSVDLQKIFTRAANFKKTDEHFAFQF